jgi:hypothetical protein
MLLRLSNGSAVPVGLTTKELSVALASAGIDGYTNEIRRLVNKHGGILTVADIS